MNRRDRHDIIVVGAGIAGAATALALLREGMDVAIIEPRPPASWSADNEVDARVVALAADAVALFAELDVWTSIRTARACAYSRMCVWDALAPGELVFDAAERGEAALGWIVENALLQHVLWQALQRAQAQGAPLRLLCPAQLAGVEERAAGAVEVCLDDGTRLRGRILVGADGATSPLRGMLGIECRERDYGQRAIVCHVRSERAHLDTAWQRFQPGGPLAFLPLADGRSSIVWSRPEADAERLLALDDARFCAELGAALDFRLGPILASTPRRAFPLRLRLAERYVEGGCVLLGDAAHVVHPLAGQGLNLGLRDVRALRDGLVAARARGLEIGAATTLRRYERERRSENTVGARSFDLIERVFSPESMPLAGLRGAALGLAQRITPLRHLLADAAAGRLAR